MKRLTKVLTAMLAAGLSLAVLAGCNSNTATTTSKTPTDTTVVLTVTSGSNTKTFTMTELKALNAVSGYAGTKNKKGEISGPKPYRGVSLTEVLSSVGGLPTGSSVQFTAADEYAKTLTYDQISSGTFTTYDTSGNAADPEKKPVVFVAYEIDGAALDASSGPVQLAVMTCEQQVTDGSNFVKQLIKIEVKAP